MKVKAHTQSLEVEELEPVLQLKRKITYEKSTPFGLRRYQISNQDLKATILEVESHENFLRENFKQKNGRESPKVRKKGIEKNLKHRFRKQCYKCNSFNHIMRNCPKQNKRFREYLMPKSSGKNEWNICKKCGFAGHRQSECMNGKRCQNCNMFHDSKICDHIYEFIDY